MVLRDLFGTRVRETDAILIYWSATSLNMVVVEEVISDRRNVPMYVRVVWPHKDLDGRWHIHKRRKSASIGMVVLDGEQVWRWRDEEYAGKTMILQDWLQRRQNRRQRKEDGERWLEQAMDIDSPQSANLRQ